MDLSSKIHIISSGANPSVFIKLANWFAFSFNSLYVKESFSNTNAVLSGVFSTCSSNNSIIDLSFG